EVRAHATDRPRVFGAERVPSGSVLEGQPGVGRGELRVLQLERIAGGDSHPGAAARRKGGERADVVLDDGVGLDLAKDLDQAVVDVPRAVEQRLPGGRHELVELLERALAEDRRRVADEVLPELA